MPFVSHGPIVVETDTSGDALVYSDEVIDGGYAYLIIFDHNYTQRLAPTAQVRIVTEHGRVPILILDGVPSEAGYVGRYFPVAIGHDTGGAAVEWADGSPAIPLRVPIPIANERIEISVSDGGSEKYAEFTVVLIENWWVTPVPEEE